MHTMGVSAPSLHRESTDSLIVFTRQERMQLSIVQPSRGREEAFFNTYF